MTSDFTKHYCRDESTFFYSTILRRKPTLADSRSRELRGNLACDFTEVLGGKPLSTFLEFHITTGEQWLHREYAKQTVRRKERSSRRAGGERSDVRPHSKPGSVTGAGLPEQTRPRG